GLWLGVVGGLLAVLVGLLVVVVLRPASPDSSALGQGSSVPILDPKSSASASSPSASAPDDWRSWPVWEFMPPPEMLPRLYAEESREDWRFPETLRGWTLNYQDYGIIGDRGAGVAYEEGGEQGRALKLEMKSLALPKEFNYFLGRLDDVHYVGRLTCGTTRISKDPECFAYAEDTLIGMRPFTGSFTEQEIVAMMDELVDHLLATR
ncbi:hypothetical protein, partial [Tessaracoccus sp. OH4464_COT-324]|uniref:hypothetical protein n=1 Tax=Tessaracoccus sp. OH4464_COT-324 TaxID=2491059 RepID=UPI001319BCB3